MARVTRATSIEALRPVLRLGVLGGTFDPPHRGHLAMADAARAALSLDHVVVIPAGDPWRKHGSPVTAARHRLAMAAAAVVEHDHVSLSDMEVRRTGSTHTVETLAALRSAGYAQIWFILGSDALTDLPHWREPTMLIRLARLAVIARPDSSIHTSALEAAIPGITEVVDWVAMDPLDLSATTLRAQIERAAAGDAAARSTVEAAIPAPVLAYIQAHKLYASEESGR